MVPEKKLMEQAFEILQEKGQKSVELARQSVFREPIEYEPLKEALTYFISDWNNVLHPALVTLACEAVGGKNDSATELGAALVLLAGGADVHDDVIDESKTKMSSLTVFGKFGIDLAILAGDALLLKGIYLLQEACEKFDAIKKKTIFDQVKRAFFEISGAEAAETNLRGRFDISKQQYLDIIRHKVAAGEVAAGIGALIGDGTPEEVGTLAEFGRVYGVLMSIREEFINVFEKEEVSNRAKREILPLPILATLADKSKKSNLMNLIAGEITEEKIGEIVDIATNSAESAQLVSEMAQMVNQLILKVQTLRYGRENLELLARAVLEDL